MKVNIFYIIIAIFGIVGIPMLKNSINTSNDFFGIAETQGRNISYPYPVLIKKLFVQIGSSVNKDDTLVILERADFFLKTNQLKFNIEEIKSKINLAKSRLGSEISIIEGNIKQAKLSTLQKTNDAKIDKEKFEQQIRNFPDLPISDKNNTLKYELVIKKLNEDLNLESDLAAVKISKLKNENEQLLKSYNIQIESLLLELRNLEEQGKSLTILAPEQCIIGQLNGQIGDQLQAYTDIMKIYGPHPNLITSYIGDGQITAIKLGDSARIQSLNDPNIMVTGVVEGLGTRITNFPERLKKVPEMRLWGREVQIKISDSLSFLQGEKVKVNFSQLTQ